MKTKTFKHAKVTYINWAPYTEGGCYIVYFKSKKKTHFKGFNGTDMTYNDCSYLYLHKPFGTPYAVLLKLAYQKLAKIKN